MFKIISRLFKTPARGVTFRIVFVSPFFELEVRNGRQHWQSVQSQKLIVKAANPKAHILGTSYYPILHFPSYTEAENYAVTTLGIEKTSQSYLNVFSSSPSSTYAWEVEADLLSASDTLNGKTDLASTQKHK